MYKNSENHNTVKRPLLESFGELSVGVPLYHSLNIVPSFIRGLESFWP